MIRITPFILHPTSTLYSVQHDKSATTKLDDRAVPISKY